MNFTSPILRRLFFICADILIIFNSVFIAFNLRFDFNIPSRFIIVMWIVVALLIIVRIPLFYFLRIYDISWRHFGFNDTTRLINSVIFSTLFLLVVTYLFRDSIVIPRSIIAIEFFISLFLILALRIAKRLYLQKYRKNALGKYTLVIAEIDKANHILRAIDHDGSPYYPIAIVNDTHDMMKINDINVYSFEHLKKENIGFEAIIIDKDIDIKSVYDRLALKHNVEIKVVSDYLDKETKLEDISVEDLLARRPKDLDKQKIRNFLKDKVVLITGAGGSIGSELCIQAISYGVKQLIAVDNCEFNLYSISEKLSSNNVISVMKNVTDYAGMEETFQYYKPEIVIHAAAYKHVPLVESNVAEGIKNNVIGTKNIIDLACAYNADKFILISTDKAVRPTNVMGCTKRICELYAQNVVSAHTEIVAVRFGNVLGSSGSVIPKFKQQIQEGGPLTVTHPEITRYFMLIPEACELVLQAGAIGKGGEIFILDMGEPVKIVDLAQKMIELSGKKDIKIEFTGLRPGEKLYEELLLDETDATTEYASITVAKPTYYALDKLNKDIEILLRSQDKIKKLQEIVPEFDHKTNKG